MASSGTLYSGTPASNVGLYGAKQKFVWSATPSDEPGVTNVKWDLYCVGKESASSNTKAYTACYAYVYDNAGGTIVGGSGKCICYYSSGDTYLSYKGTWFAGGTFQVKHSNDGTGGFRVYLDVNIGGWDGSGRDANGYYSLDVNKPYSYIFIDNGTDFVKAIPYIDNGTDWQVARGYVDNGTEWKEAKY